MLWEKKINIKKKNKEILIIFDDLSIRYLIIKGDKNNIFINIFLFDISSSLLI